MTLPWSLPPLSPASNSTILAVPVTSASVALAAGSASDSNTVQVANVGTAEAFIAFGGATVAAVAQGAVTAASDGSTSIPAGAILAFSINNQGYAAAITQSGTTTLRITRGSGT